MRSLFALFAAISIFLSCLGLYGLSSFMAERRNKEIGIRKAKGKHQSLDIFAFRLHCTSDLYDYAQLPGTKSSQDQPGHNHQTGISR